MDSTSDSIEDVLRNPWEMYQLEHMTESMYVAENKTRKNPEIMSLNIQDYFKRDLRKKAYM